MEQFAVGVAQTCPTGGDIEANIAQHTRLVELAAGFGVAVVVFPELSLTGYELELAEQLAISEADARLAPLAEASSRYSVSVVVGAPVRTNLAVHIGALVLEPDRPRKLYTKHHLGAFGEGARRDGRPPPPEASVFQPGQCEPLVALSGASAAVAICADTSWPSHPQRAAERGANVYLASMFVIPSEFDGNASRLERYAATFALVVAMANFGSETGGLAAAGRSSIWSPDGILRVRMPPNGAGVAVATRTGHGWRGEVALLDG